MRTSQAGLACITRVGPNGIEYLTQWSDTWQMFSLIGGHVEPGESFRECCERELSEELQLPRSEFTVGDSLGRIEYEAFSHSSGVMTRYLVELFAVEVREKVSNDPSNRWLSEREVVNMRTTDGWLVSEQVRTVLTRCGVNDMPARIFISAVSSEFHHKDPKNPQSFESYRDVLTRSLRRQIPGCQVIVQEELKQSYGDLLHTLDLEVKDSTVMVHLIGGVAGARPEEAELRALQKRHPEFLSHKPELKESLPKRAFTM